MKINIKKFQEGGEISADPQSGAPAPEQGAQDPLMQLVQMAAQALQAQDPNMAFQVCQALVQLAQGGGGAPEGQPVFRKGGKIVRWQK